MSLMPASAVQPGMVAGRQRAGDKKKHAGGGRDAIKRSSGECDGVDGLGAGAGEHDVYLRGALLEATVARNRWA